MRKRTFEEEMIRKQRRLTLQEQSKNRRNVVIDALNSLAAARDKSLATSKANCLPDSMEIDPKTGKIKNTPVKESMQDSRIAGPATQENAVRVNVLSKVKVSRKPRFKIISNKKLKYIIGE